MPQLAFTCDLKNDPEAIARYKAYHQEVWPEVLDALRQVGVLEMKIWLLGTRMMMWVNAVEGFDPDRDFARYQTLHPRIPEWEALMSQFQQPLPEAGSGEKWLRMEEVFNSSEF